MFIKLIEMGAITKSDKAMINIDPTSKVKLNELKSYFLKTNSKDPNASRNCSYRNIVKNAIEQMHERVFKHG